MKLLNIIKREVGFFSKWIIAPVMLVAFISSSIEAVNAYQTATHFAEHQNSMVHESRDKKLSAENYVRYSGLRGLQSRPLVYKIVFMKTYLYKLNPIAVAIYK